MAETSTTLTVTSSISYPPRIQRLLAREEKRLDYVKQWQKSHPEKVKAYKATFNSKHPTYHKEYYRAYRQAQRAIINKYKAELLQAKVQESDSDRSLLTQDVNKSTSESSVSVHDSTPGSSCL